MATYPLPRGADGRILIDDSSLREELPPAAVEQTPAPAPASSPATSPTPAPARRRGENPTPLGQLRPGAVAGGGQPHSPASDGWRLAFATLATVAILAVAGYGLWATQPAPAPAAPMEAPAEQPGDPAAVAAPTAAPTTSATATPAAELARAIVVFDAPGGTPVGALEPGRGYTLLEERDGWRKLQVAGSGTVWARAWEMDGQAPPTPTVLPTAAPAAPAPAPRQSAPVVAPVGPAETCVPVVDADNGNRYLGDACGATAEERRAEALRLLEQAPPPTLPGARP